MRGMRNEEKGYLTRGPGATTSTVSAQPAPISLRGVRENYASAGAQEGTLRVILDWTALVKR